MYVYISRLAIYMGPYSSSVVQENRLRAASAKCVSAACCYTTSRTRRFIRTQISLRWSSWSSRVTITPLIATVLAANYASTRTARTTVIASTRPTAITCTNVLRVTPRTTALLTLTNASTTNVRTVRLASTVSRITPACARTADRDGCAIATSTSA
ncbi:PREDICTED: uncharacterized protein LOC105555994 [Vollenhovia emeryi]|uniref:uncharacterized protein LOC105555994 n=1 Tax=Vollenhovia emeryi TaxID=411798 RepID=UPI0005F4A908|nr:PREDICTED: uncharacterized protein LOC105555994 [Vollenhovia emeryi]